MYFNPPQQALDRTRPGLPLKKGRCGTRTHDYKRNGTTTLFAALELLEGKVIGQRYPRHRHQEFLRFLRRLDGEFPTNLSLHLEIDNYAIHSQPAVKAGSSAIRVSWFTLSLPVAVGVPDLIMAIEEFLEAWNENPKPFVWRATVESIVAKLSRCRKNPGANPTRFYTATQEKGPYHCIVNCRTLH